MSRKLLNILGKHHKTLLRYLDFISSDLYIVKKCQFVSIGNSCLIKVTQGLRGLQVILNSV